MKILVVSSAGDNRIRRVIWQADTNLVACRRMYDDGVTSDEAMPQDTLYEAMEDISNEYTDVRLVEIADLRSAFKYLGKSADLINTLPELDVNDIINPASAAS